MNIKNGLYMDVEIRWNAVNLPLKAGTPISVAGVEANNETAIGIIPQTISEKPTISSTKLLIGGAVFSKEVEAEYGSAIEAAAKRNMSGIAFFGEDGTPEADPVWSLPEATTSTLGGVKKAANVADAAGEAPTAAEFKALLDALKAAGIMVADA